MTSLPLDTRWCYYMGERKGTYTVRTAPVIPARIRALARKGYWFTLCSTLRASPEQGMVVDVIRANLNEAVQCSFRGLDGFAAEPKADAIGVAAGAEFAWNCKGRSTEEFFATWAADHGEGDPEITAQAYLDYDRANHRIALLNSTGIGHPSGSFSQIFSTISRLRANPRMDEIDIAMSDRIDERDLPLLAECIRSLERAAHIAEEHGAETLRLRSEVLLCLARVCRDALYIFHVVAREKSYDTSKGQWSDWRHEIREAAARIECQRERAEPFLKELEEHLRLGLSNPIQRLAEEALSLDPAAIASSRG